MYVSNSKDWFIKNRIKFTSVLLCTAFGSIFYTQCFGSKLSNAVYTKLIYLNNMYYHAMNIIMLEN